MVGLGLGEEDHRFGRSGLTEEDHQGQEHDQEDTAAAAPAAEAELPGPELAAVVVQAAQAELHAP